MRKLGDEVEELMGKVVEHLGRELATIRTGRATPVLLERIMVSYYGTPTPINQLAAVNVPEPRLLVIQPWDKSVIPEIERAIMKSDLGITPSSDGTVIRLAMPQLTQERRQDLVKQVRKKAEDGRVAVRNIRREVNEKLKVQEKGGEFSEDDLKWLQEEVQKLTDKYTKKVDEVLKVKEAEILEV